MPNELMTQDLQRHKVSPYSLFSREKNTRGGFTIEFSEMRGPNKIFGSFCEINEPNILFGPLISENSIVKPPLAKSNKEILLWS